MRRPWKYLIVSIFGLSLAASCTDIGDYSTDPGECYQGKIITAEYVRSETFLSDLQLTLTLDANALSQGKPGATITTSDGRFNQASVLQLSQLSHDSLSLLQFPGGRVHNYLTYAQPNQGHPATVVISLMENEEVEVRILRPNLTQNDAEDSSLFGVFRLVRKEDCGTETADN